MKTFKEFINEAQWMYHGTTNDFDSLQPNRNAYMVDRAIGTHFASDKDIAKKFANDLYKSNPNVSKKGVMLKTQTPPRSKIEKVPQKTYYKINGKSVKESDQNAIATHVAHTVFSEHPDGKELFKHYIKTISNGTTDDDTIEKLHSHLSQGKSVHDWNVFGASASKANTFRSYVSNKGGVNQFAGASDLVPKFLEVMKSKGIKGLSYLNTSPSETEGVRGHKCYVLFNPHEHENPIFSTKEEE